MASLMELLFGKSPKIKQQQLLNPSQQQLFSNVVGSLGGQAGQGFDYLSRILSQDPEQIREFEVPTLRSFQEETIPSILERFSGMGARSSSGLNQALARAGERLQESLGAQRAGLQQSAASQLFNLLGIGLQPTTQPYIRQGTSGLSPFIGSALASIGGPAFSALGGGLGSLIDRYFQDKQSQPYSLTPGTLPIPSYYGILGGV